MIVHPFGARVWIARMVVAALAIIIATPFLWVVCASLKRPEDLFTSTFLPWQHLSRLTLDNYRQFLGGQTFQGWLINSLFLASAHTVLVVTLSSLGGFALAKYHFAGQRAIMGLMLATMLLPSQILLPSSYELMYRLGWIDSYAAILVPGAVSVFGIFLFRQAMAGVPDDLLDAARVDGCGELRLWWQIAMPMVRPMLGAYTLMSFMSSWNSFLWPQIILQSQGKYTLPLGLGNLIGMREYQEQYGILMAGTLLSVLPIVVLFAILQRDFISGLTSGAVKG